MYKINYEVRIISYIFGSVFVGKFYIFLECMKLQWGLASEIVLLRHLLIFWWIETFLCYLYGWEYVCCFWVVFIAIWKREAIKLLKFTMQLKRNIIIFIKMCLKNKTEAPPNAMHCILTEIWFFKYLFIFAQDATLLMNILCRLVLTFWVKGDQLPTLHTCFISK